jgi:hypothetical protein
LGVRGGRGSPEQGVPRWRNPSGGERWWGHGGAVGGADKVVEGAHGVGADLGAVSMGSERDRRSFLWWLYDSRSVSGGAGAMKWRRRKKGGGGALHNDALLL